MLIAFLKRMTRRRFDSRRIHIVEGSCIKTSGTLKFRPGLQPVEMSAVTSFSLFFKRYCL